MTETLAEQAVKAVKARVPKSKALSARSATSFLDGTLVTVDYVDEQGDDDTQFVLFQDNTVHVLEFAEDVVEVVRENIKYSFFHRMVYSLLNIGGISGLIAIIIVFAMIFMMFSRIPVDENWWRIFTLVIGFYFGNVTGRK
jgi:hypothetical protein